MPDATLHDNHDPCPACELQQAAQDRAPVNRTPVRCQLCGGICFLALSAAEITARMAADARLHHWPDFERRIRRDARRKAAAARRQQKDTSP